MSILMDFTRALSAGAAIAQAEVRRVLPGLYLSNTSSSNPKLVYDGDYPNIYPQAYGEYLDLLGEMFDKKRLPGEPDESYRQRILLSLSQSVTTSGLKKTLEFLFSLNGLPVDVYVTESYVDAFDGTSNGFDTPLRDYRGSLLYGVSVTVSPRNQKRAVRFVPLFTPVEDEDYILDSDGNKVYNLSGEKVLVRLKDASGEDAVFNKYAAIHTKGYLEAFNVSAFKYIIEDLAAAGTRLTRVLILGPGAGANKGD